MRIVISGTAGSGKSTVAKKLAQELGYAHHSTGDFMRELASQRNITVLKLAELALKDPEIDKQVDSTHDLLNNENNFVVDSRLGAFFIKNAKKIFLDADLKTRARRILNDVREAETHITIKETIKAMKKREEYEKKRYKAYYGLNAYDKTKFDLVIDTTKLDAEEVVEKIEYFIKK